MTPHITPLHTAPAPAAVVHEHITDAMKAPDLLRLTNTVVLARFETMKIYAALGAVRTLLERGTIAPGQTLVDSSSGIYALALAMACHRYGLRCHIVASTTVDATMRAQLEILGATVDQMPPSQNLRLDQERRVARVRQLIAERPGMHWMRQYHDAIHYAGYREFADLIDDALPDVPLSVVGAVGTGASTAGLVQPLRERGRPVTLLGVQPFGSVTFGSEGFQDPEAIIAGIGSSIPFDNVRHDLYDTLHWVDFRHAMAGAVDLLRNHAVFAGLSTGAAHGGRLGGHPAPPAHVSGHRSRHRTPLRRTGLRPPPRSPRPPHPTAPPDHHARRPGHAVVGHGLEPTAVRREPHAGQGGEHLVTIAALEALTFGLARLAEAAENAGHRLALLTQDRAVYRHELAHLPPDAALDIIDVDTSDEEATAEALAALPDPRGLLNSTDTWSVPGAGLAARFGLPGPDPASVRLLRDKHRVRNLLHEHGLSRGRALALAADPAAAGEVVRTTGLPAVLKDSAGTSSRNVWVVRDEHQLRAALTEAARQTFSGHLFAEPFLAGPVYSAETLSWAGHTRLLGVLSRQLSPEPSVREEAAAFPVALPDPEHALVQDWVGRVLKTAGHDSGFAHVEFVLTTEGPELVEINRRIGGALVGEALCRALETNVYDALVDTALGRRPALLDAPAPTGPATGFVLIYPDRPGTLTGWTGLDGLAAFPGSPEWYPTATPGDRVEHLSDQRGCTGILLVEAATAELALHRALSAAGSVRPLIDTRDVGE